MQPGHTPAKSSPPPASTPQNRRSSVRGSHSAADPRREPPGASVHQRTDGSLSREVREQQWQTSLRRI
ncbi:hypothetical protein NDU88_000095 [Pleurodeles waltl]|uniref:Uncharacterized protein n=1 Tax=Pleurodeles waltl TaxID=8319 RepID=A0AAV7VVI7_PLEWA|nr:hypothetical protein NDU88_000095 [Pleurodeles waltl]